jgi:quercetin dioxygenase-like cupin family protein
MSTTSETQSISSQLSSRVFGQSAPGVEVCVLRAHREGGLTFCVRMHKGARAERHGHPGGEEMYVVSGRVRVDYRAYADNQAHPDILLGEGDYFFAPAGETHSVFAEEACTLLVVAAGGIDRAY